MLVTGVSGANRLLLVCAGTFDECAYEDVLGAGAICAQMRSFEIEEISDAANLARMAWEREKDHLYEAISSGKNGYRLLNRPELREDVRFCAQRDVFDFAVKLGRDGWLSKVVS